MCTSVIRLLHTHTHTHDVTVGPTAACRHARLDRICVTPTHPPPNHPPPNHPHTYTMLPLGPPQLAGMRSVTELPCANEPLSAAARAEIQTTCQTPTCLHAKPTSKHNLSPTPYALSPQPETPSLKPSAQNLKPQALNPKP